MTADLMTPPAPSPVHGPAGRPGTSLPLGLAPAGWWRNRYAAPRVAAWRAVSALLPQAPHHGAVAVDLGCGSGPFHPALAARGWRAVGVDPLTGAAQVGGLAERLPLRDGCAGLVLSVNVMQYLPDPEAVCAEALRVLEPGGKLVLCLPAVSPFDHLDLWRWTGHAAAGQLERAGFAQVEAVAYGATVGNLAHLLALSVRKRVPLAGPALAAGLETAAVLAIGRGDRRLPVGYVLRAERPA
jgi:SAM-dependent methyltransferase